MRLKQIITHVIMQHPALKSEPVYVIFFWQQYLKTGNQKKILINSQSVVQYFKKTIPRDPFSFKKHNLNPLSRPNIRTRNAHAL